MNKLIPLFKVAAKCKSEGVGAASAAFSRKCYATASPPQIPQGTSTPKQVQEAPSREIYLENIPGTPPSSKKGALSSTNPAENPTSALGGGATASTVISSSGSARGVIGSLPAAVASLGVALSSSAKEEEISPPFRTHPQSIQVDTFVPLSAIKIPGLKAFVDAGKGGYAAFLTRGPEEHLGVILGQPTCTNSGVAKFEAAKMALRHIERVKINGEDIEIFSDYETLMLLWHKRANMTNTSQKGKSVYKVIHTIGKCLRKEGHAVDIHHLPRELNTLANKFAEIASCLPTKVIVEWKDMRPEWKDIVNDYFK